MLPDRTEEVARRDNAPERKENSDAIRSFWSLVPAIRQ